MKKCFFLLTNVVPFFYFILFYLCFMINFFLKIVLTSIVTSTAFIRLRSMYIFSVVSVLCIAFEIYAVTCFWPVMREIYGEVLFISYLFSSSFFFFFSKKKNENKKYIYSHFCNC